jgi:hypothetical protein
MAMKLLQHMTVYMGQEKQSIDLSITSIVWNVSLEVYFKQKIPVTSTDLTKYDEKCGGTAQ